MVEKRCAKEAQKKKIVSGCLLNSFIYSYPDKLKITNLFHRGFLIQMKGGFK